MTDVKGKESAARPPARAGAAGALTPRPERHCVAPPGRLCPRSPPGSRKTSEGKRSAEQTTEMLWQRSYAR